jgi:putative Holliday junction resolvase
MRDPKPAAPIASRFPAPAVFPMTDQVVLAFDFGTRRIGAAIGNTITRHARPLHVLDDRSERDRWRQIAALLEQWHPARLVVGVPRHADGHPHEMTARCERFARQLAGRYGLPVSCVDEAFSSSVGGRSGTDADAAAVILQQWFDEQACHAAATALAAHAQAGEPGGSPGDQRQ